MSRHVWSIAEVADTVGPAANLRNYLEQRDVRRCLAAAVARRPIRRACDVGCGYGRLTMVLTEFAPEVVGFEREPSFVEAATRLMPAVRFVEVPSLGALPAPDGSFDFAMTFTVLQHMRDDGARNALAEVKRVTQGGFVLLTEETDTSLAAEGDEASVGVTVGRAENTYVEWMRPFEPILRFAREIEPGYPRADVGTYMLFADPRPKGA
jgi:SAM-dependent methyltransferase